ncbi:MAG: hypothetical protein CBE49_001780 [Rickettsiales bacterium TMED289]|nr:hypothetical protein [Gammaproteobacteria bacterium]RPF74441.1 MAG: hypothetical protein CBE49_001780 [Rickettsiales bacterium TMED289]|tara:strand:- start:8107 stop:8376 length:270 start_codon:yes stop_codon:yes gene_type:complete
MSKINILTLIALTFLISGCSSVENNSFGKEHEKKINELKEDCSFATIDYDRTGNPLYICYKDSSSLKRSKKNSDKETEESDTEETTTVD